MRKVIMIGCDLHDKTMLLKIALRRPEAVTCSSRNRTAGRAKMIAALERRAAAA